MKRITILIITALFFTLVRVSKVASVNSCDSTQKKIELKPLDTNNPNKLVDTTNLSLTIGVINNIMAWSAVIIAILTFIVAIFGIVGYHRIKEILKENINKNSDIINKKIIEINNKETEMDNCIMLTKSIADKLNGQEKYLNNTNQYLFEALDKIANQISDSNFGKAILKEVLHNFQITNLYSIDKNKKFAALAYIQENGTLNDIEHLEYVTSYDAEDGNKIWAREIIGMIKHRCSK